MNRQLYQMGGIGTLPMDFGQPLQVPQQPQPSFSSAQNITMNPLLNYGQPQLGGGTPLTMAGGGISRLGYQEGGMGMEQMMQDPMMQEQMMQPPMQDQMQAPMQGQMMPAAGGEEQGQNAILTIIQLLIEQGIDPETAKELAAQILEAFAQGGEPAVEALANQLEQEEGMQQPMMMAEGGLTSIDRARDMLQSKAPRGEFLAYINPQEAGILRLMGGAGQDVNVRGVPSYFKKIFKSVGKAVSSVAKAVKSVAKSPIGMIALSIAAPYAIGAMFPGFATLGTASLGTFGGAALRAGISNLAIQGITTGKINPKQALMAAVGGGIAGSVFGPAGNLSTDSGTLSAGGLGIPGADVAVAPTTLSSGVVQSLPTSAFSELTGQVAPGSMVYNPPTTAAGTYPSLGFEVSPTSPVVNVGATQPNLFEKGITSIKDFGTKLMDSPLQTLSGVGSDALKLVKDNKELALLGGTLALSALDQQPGESDDAYKLRAQTDPRVAQYITQYGGAAKVYSPGASGLYAMEGAVDPFAGRLSYAANGGRIGYAEGSTSFEKQTLEKKGYGDMMKNMTPREISQLYDSVMGTFSRRFQAEGSMPMGEPRRNPAGIMELDYRAKGGFVPPIGIKEKADDIPAMLSNNEFVFTADAVRAAGGGSVNKGAQKMYSLMRQLEGRA